MTLIPNEKELENLLKEMPYFPATITSTLIFMHSPFTHYLNFKYDNSEITGEMKMSKGYALALVTDYDVDTFSELKDAKIRVYTPSIESGKIYAILPIVGMSPEEKLDFDKRCAEFREKFKDVLKK